MKYIILIIGLLVVGCGETYPPPMPPEKTNTNESTPTTNTNKADGTTEKPVKELTLEEEKVVGTYEMKKDGKTLRIVLLKTSVAEKYIDGKKEDKERKWKIAKGEIHIIAGSGHIDVIRINKDGSLTGIANIDKDGERKEAPKDKQFTAKKIK